MSWRCSTMRVDLRSFFLGDVLRCSRTGRISNQAIRRLNWARAGAQSKGKN